MILICKVLSIFPVSCHEKKEDGVVEKKWLNKWTLQGLGLAAVCDCGTPWTFLLTFFN